MLALMLACRLGVSREKLVHNCRGALLHDIGKLGGILLKRGRLTYEELEVVKKHPTFAHEMLGDNSYLAPALAIPNDHHERWDGSAYPVGLEGESIPLAASIFAMVDVDHARALRASEPRRAPQ